MATLLTLNRCWPQSASHLLLEYMDTRGQLVPGQWYSDPADLERQLPRLAAIAPEQFGVVSTDHGDRILLQPRGCDAEMIALHDVLQTDTVQLLSHRPGKRAVVHQQLAEESRFLKFFGATKTFRRAIERLSWVQQLGGQELRTAMLLSQDPTARQMAISHVEGHSLFDLLQRGWSDLTQCHQLGATLRLLHAGSPPAGMAVHEPADEQRVLGGWIDNVTRWFPACGSQLASLARPVIEGLAGVSPRRGVLHRDLHDKQILLAESLSPGFIDFDTLAWGPPAQDLANLLAHLEFRVLQGKASTQQARSIGQAIRDGYDDPAIAADLPLFLDATRLRLACLYAFRPRWRTAAVAITTRLGCSFATD